MRAHTGDVIADDAGEDAGSTADAAAADAAKIDASGGDSGVVRCNYSTPFGVPGKLASISTNAIDSAPTLSSDELTIYFYSDRSGGPGGVDLYVATRSSTSQPFGNAQMLSVSSSADDYDPFVTADGLSLLFASSRSGNLDLYVATRPTPAADFGNTTTITELDTSNDDAQPFLAEVQKEIYFGSNRPGGAGGMDIYRASHTGSTYGTPAMVASLSSSADDAAPVISADGLAIYFASTRDGSQSGYDIWMATRATTASDFDAPVAVNELNTTGFDRPGWLSADGCRLYMSSDRGGDVDLYVAARQP